MHWYPGRFVTVDANGITCDETNAIKSAILEHWDSILGENASSIPTVVATGPAVTNAVGLLNNGYRPELDLTASPPTLTFDNRQTIRISDFVVTNLPTAILEATILPHDTQPEVNLWGAPTLTSGWSPIESEGDFSKFAAEGIVSFEFDVSTNRFFKVIAQ